MLRVTAANVTHMLPDLLLLRDTSRLKMDGTPVTDADVLVEQAIHESLCASLDSVRFIGEEGSVSTVFDDSEWTAVVDPIDGTENFASGLPEWGVCVSLWHGGIHVASMLQLPELSRCLISGDSVPRYQSRLTGFSSKLDEALVAELSETPHSRITGSAAYNMWCVITGSFATFSNPVGAWSWDILAGISLALEYGCEVTLDDKIYDGRYLESDRTYRFEVRR